MGLEEAKECAESDDWVVHHVGWLLHETKQYLLIASAWTRDGGFTGVHKIPKGWVVTRKTLNVRKGG